MPDQPGRTNQRGFASSVNSTTTLLASGGTYTGTGEMVDYPQVGVYMRSDVAGTLYFEWSVDGTTWYSFPTAGYTVSASIPEFHTAVKLVRHFRPRFVMDAGTQTEFFLVTYYGDNFVPSVNPINANIGTDQDALVTKSVISGVGNTNAIVTDHQALQVTKPPEGKTVFGEDLVASLESQVELLFHIFISSQTTESRANQSGSVTQSNGMAVLATGAAANSSGSILSVESVRYHPGHGVRARFTAVFTTGVANSTQIIGVGGPDSGLFFGYNGTSFGIMRRTGGVPEVRTLTVSTASTTDEDITITLDGDAKTDVTVTNSGNTTTTANEIAAADYSDVGRGWKADAVGSTVIFTSWEAGAKTGTYSLSSASTAVGSFAQTLAGVASTDTWVAQSSWNGTDKFDGTGITGVTLDPTKGNVFQITYQYLGFGAMNFFVEDPDDGELHLVHTISYANNNTAPSLSEPTGQLFAIAENTSNTSNLTLSIGSMAGFVDGEDPLIGQRRGIKQGITLGATAAETPIVTLRNKEVFNSKINKAQVKMLKISASVEHTKPVAINFYRNATLTGASFSDIDSNVSIVQKDSSATAISGGIFLYQLNLGKAGNETSDFDHDKFSLLLSPGETITATIAPKSGNAAEAQISMYFVELF